MKRFEIYSVYIHLSTLHSPLSKRMTKSVTFYFQILCCVAFSPLCYDRRGIFVRFGESALVCVGRDSIMVILGSIPKGVCPIGCVLVFLEYLYLIT